MSLLEHLVHCEDEPSVIKHCIRDWPAAAWTPQSLHNIVGKPLRWRIGPKQQSEVLWEGDCHYIHATLQEYTAWLTGEAVKDTPFAQVDRQHMWCYADYMYMKDLFDGNDDILKAVDWSIFGCTGRHGQESSMWIGSEGANTPCHYDTYGCNLVAQIYGRKRWILFPPHNNENMYPSRIPYEESSVFSEVCVNSPDLIKHKKFQVATPYIVTLVPGDVLYVPKHWWHYVETTEPSISINTWVEMACDDTDHVSEALARTLACTFMSVESHEQPNIQEATCWLNPTEEKTPHETNMKYLNFAVEKLQSGKLSMTSSCPTSENSKTMGKHKNRSSNKCSCSPSDDHNAETYLDFEKPKRLKLEKQTCGANSSDTYSNARSGSRTIDSFEIVNVQQVTFSRYLNKIGHNHSNEDTSQIAPKHQVNYQSTISTRTLLKCLLDPDIIILLSNKLLSEIEQ